MNGRNISRRTLRAWDGGQLLSGLYFGTRRW